MNRGWITSARGITRRRKAGSLGFDPENAGATLDDPQSWNGYAYARSNPLLFVDPDGQEFVVCGPNGCGTLTDDQFYEQRKAFKELGFTFTGHGDFFEGGDIISPQMDK